MTKRAYVWPPRPCDTCHTKTTAASGTCPPCQRAASAKPDDSHALAGGRWVTVGLTQRYVLDDPEPIEPEPVIPVRELPPSAIACPTCKATVTETCRSATGQRSKDHAARWVKRQCPCGEPVGKGQTACDACRERAVA